MGFCSISIVYSLSLSKDEEIQKSFLSWLTFSGLKETEFLELFVEDKIYHSLDKTRLSIAKPAHSKWLTFISRAILPDDICLPPIAGPTFEYTSSLIKYLDLNDLSLGYQIIYRIRMKYGHSTPAYTSTGGLGAFSTFYFYPYYLGYKDDWEKHAGFKEAFPDHEIGTHIKNEGTMDPEEELPPQEHGELPVETWWNPARTHAWPYRQNSYTS